MKPIFLIVLGFALLYPNYIRLLRQPLLKLCDATGLSSLGLLSLAADLDHTAFPSFESER